MLQLIPGGGLKAVEDDTSPKLGGNLDGGGFNISNVGTGTFGDLVIKSPDGFDQVNIYHDNTNAYLKWTDGVLRLETDEGTNSHGIIQLRGKGTGYGQLRMYDEDNAEYLVMTASGGTGRIYTGGTAPQRLDFQPGGNIPVTYFQASPEGFTSELRVYGFRTGDAKRLLQISVGKDAADTATFDGLSNYYFGGNVGIGVADPHSKLQVYGAISSASVIVVSSVDNLNVSGVNNLFVNTSGGDVTLGGLTGGVPGQSLNIVIFVTGNNLILEVGTGTQQFINHTGVNEVLDGGGAIYICDGSNWFDASHAKHV